MLNKIELAWQNNSSQYDQTLNIFVELYNFVSSYPMVAVDILQSYVNCFFYLQAVTNINTLLDKADRVYHQLMGHRPQLESLLAKVNEAAPEKPQVCLERHEQRKIIFTNIELTRLMSGMSRLFLLFE